jgi:hypothetical protein
LLKQEVQFIFLFLLPSSFVFFLLALNGYNQLIAEAIEIAIVIIILAVLL